MSRGTAESKSAGAVEAPAGLTLIDCDVHDSTVKEDLYPYLSDRWRRYLETVGLRQRGPTSLVAGAHKAAARTDSWGPEGQAPGTDPAWFCTQLFEGSDSRLAVLNPVQAQMQERYGPGSPLELIREVQRAGNELVRDKWLDFDSRLRAAIVVAHEDAAGSVAEIERWVDDTRFVQVLFPFRTGQPMGQQRYWPIYEAATHHGLPIAMHPALQHTHTGAGWPSFYYENHTGFPASLFPQVASLISEGTFDRFPDLQIVIAEGGWSWMPPLMWRMDRAWKQLREEMVHLERRPSEYVRDHFWFTTQPVDNPDNPKHLTRVFEQFAEAGLAGRLMFSSDYPHWDWDDPATAIPATLPDDWRQAIFVENALSCYPRLQR